MRRERACATRRLSRRAVTTCAADRCGMSSWSRERETRKRPRVTSYDTEAASETYCTRSPVIIAFGARCRQVRSSTKSGWPYSTACPSSTRISRIGPPARPRPRCRRRAPRRRRQSAPRARGCRGRPAAWCRASCWSGRRRRAASAPRGAAAPARRRAGARRRRRTVILVLGDGATGAGLRRVSLMPSPGLRW